MGRVSEDRTMREAIFEVSRGDDDEPVSQHPTAAEAVEAWRLLVEAQERQEPLRVWDVSDPFLGPGLVASSVVEEVGLTAYGRICVELGPLPQTPPVAYDADLDPAAYRRGFHAFAGITGDGEDVEVTVGGTLEIEADTWTCRVRRLGQHLEPTGAAVVFRGRLDDPAFGALALLAGAARMPEIKERRSPN